MISEHVSFYHICDCTVLTKLIPPIGSDKDVENVGSAFYILNRRCSASWEVRLGQEFGRWLHLFYLDITEHVFMDSKHRKPSLSSPLVADDDAQSQRAGVMCEVSEAIQRVSKSLLISNCPRPWVKVGYASLGYKTIITVV